MSKWFIFQAKISYLVILTVKHLVAITISNCFLLQHLLVLLPLKLWTGHTDTQQQRTLVPVFPTLCVDGDPLPSFLRLSAVLSASIFLVLVTATPQFSWQTATVLVCCTYLLLLQMPFCCNLYITVSHTDSVNVDMKSTFKLRPTLIGEKFFTFLSSFP